MTGFECFLNGFALLIKPGLRRFFIMPIIINALVLMLLVVASYIYFDDWIAAIMALFPDWAAGLHWLLRGMTFIILLVVLYYSFTFLANLIAAPFNALLSVRVEEALTGQTPTSELSAWGAVAREFSKLGYLLPRLLLLLILTLIPVINFIAPLAWILFSIWMVAIQYTDYGADNNGLSFKALRTRLRKKPLHALAFGTPVWLLLIVPLVNLILMPASVAGGTRFWTEHLRSIS